MLALESQLVADVAATGEGDLAGDLLLGASTGPAAVAVPVALAEFQRQNPDVRVFLTVSDTHSIVERVAARELELGIVGAARGIEAFASSRSSPTRSSSSARPATLREPHRHARGAAWGAADPDAGRRGSQADREDALRRQGIRLRDLDVRLELGLQESVREPSRLDTA